MQTRIILNWNNAMTVSLALSLIPVGQSGQIIEIRGDHLMSRRLLSMGLRVGSIVSVLQHRNSGVVVASGGNRVAVGASIAEKIFLQPVNND